MPPHCARLLGIYIFFKTVSEGPYAPGVDSPVQVGHMSNYSARHPECLVVLGTQGATTAVLGVGL